MELAVPLIALGGLYVASNQENKKEGYENMGKPVNSLPNYNEPPINYPVMKGVKNTNPNKYRDPNTVTDKFFQPSVYQKYRNGPDQFGNVSKTNDFKSLTGNSVSKTEFKHNNMAPFFGGKIRGSTQDVNIAETVLDNMSGVGSQQIRKQEQAPLFSPQKNMRFANGTPNQSDFYQSRVIPGSKMSNVKMWNEQKVGPALDAGYNTEGELGFNSGMAAREKWVDRNVDQLRVETNPKLSFGLANHEGPAHYFNNAPPTTQTQGKVEKYLPDKYFVNTPDRWLTTTGLEKAQTVRSIEVAKDVNRSTTGREYFGADSNPEGTKMYTPGEYQQPKRPQLQSNPVLNPNGCGSGAAGSNDYGKDGYTPLPNNRSTVRQDSGFGVVGGFMKAAVAPLLDVLRPSRKENVIGNINPTGNVQTHVGAARVWNPADRAPTTIKETTVGLLDNNHLNVEGQKDGAYTVTEQQAIDQERDTTNCEYYGDGGNGTGVALYNAAYNQRNNVNKTHKNRPNQGGMSMLNHDQKVQIDKMDQDRDNNRLWVRNGNNGINGAIPSVETYGKINVPQYYNNCQDCDRINPDILTAFKQNPYTKSLSSY
jgi:hypothetical protein|tara:strand:- start:265 stop:2043 length:1779 start_codon:yes stop_codon:yes gene_type:complete